MSSLFGSQRARSRAPTPTGRATASVDGPEGVRRAIRGGRARSPAAEDGGGAAPRGLLSLLVVPVCLIGFTACMFASFGLGAIRLVHARAGSSGGRRGALAHAREVGPWPPRATACGHFGLHVHGGADGAAEDDVRAEAQRVGLDDYLCSSRWPSTSVLLSHATQVPARRASLARAARRRCIQSARAQLLDDAASSSARPSSFCAPRPSTCRRAAPTPMFKRHVSWWSAARTVPANGQGEGSGPPSSRRSWPVVPFFAGTAPLCSSSTPRIFTA